MGKGYNYFGLVRGELCVRFLDLVLACKLDLWKRLWRWCTRYFGAGLGVCGPWSWLTICEWDLWEGVVQSEVYSIYF